jgi:hypothetical protein
MGWRSLSITLVCVVCLVATSCYPRIGDVRDERQAPTCDSELSELSADPRNCGACGIDCAGEACVSGVCRPKLLASGQTSPRVALDDTHVYWTEFLPSGFVRRTPRNGGAIELIAEGQSYPVGIALDDGAIYWAAKGTGTIAKAEKSAPFPQTQLATGHEAYAVALSNSGDSYLYWLEVGTNSCTPYKVDRTSYALSALPKLEPCGVPFGVAIDELHVYTGTLAMPGEARVYSVSKVTGSTRSTRPAELPCISRPVLAPSRSMPLTFTGSSTKRICHTVCTARPSSGERRSRWPSPTRRRASRARRAHPSRCMTGR